MAPMLRLPAVSVNVPFTVRFCVFQVRVLVRFTVMLLMDGALVKVLLGMVNAVPPVLPVVPKTNDVEVLVVMVPALLAIGVLPF